MYEIFGEGNRYIFRMIYGNVEEWWDKLLGKLTGNDWLEYYKFYL